MSTNRRLQKAARDLMGQSPGTKYTEALRQVQKASSTPSPPSAFTWDHRTSGSDRQVGLQHSPIPRMQLSGDHAAVEAIYGAPGVGKSSLAYALIAEGLRQGRSQVLVDLSGLSAQRFSQPSDLGIAPQSVTTLQLGRDLKIGEPGAWMAKVLAQRELEVTAAPLPDAWRYLAQQYVNKAVEQATALDREGLGAAVMGLPAQGMTETVARDDLALPALMHASDLVAPLVGHFDLPPQRGGLLHITANPASAKGEVEPFLLNMLLDALPDSGWRDAEVTVDHSSEEGEVALRRVVRFSRSRQQALRIVLGRAPFTSEDVFSQAAWIAATVWVGWQAWQDDRLRVEDALGVSPSSLSLGEFLVRPAHSTDIHTVRLTPLSAGHQH